MVAHAYDPPTEFSSSSLALSEKEDVMKRLALGITLALAMLSPACAQETQVGRPRDSVTSAPAAAAPVSPRVEPREQSPVPPLPVTAAPAPPPTPYNVEDPRAVIDWLLNRSSERGR